MVIIAAAVHVRGAGDGYLFLPGGGRSAVKRRQADPGGGVRTRTLTLYQPRSGSCLAFGLSDPHAEMSEEDQEWIDAPAVGKEIL
ncbi:hypothetical protein ABW09_21795 [Pluralibacter gergoviae]|nr:hypothetical protein ABW09_21795 [Pluralibacter gergoviae]